MRPAVRTPDAPTATEHRQLSSYSWQILGIVTATEHYELIRTAIEVNAPAQSSSTSQTSIGSVNIGYDAFNEPVTRAMEWMQHETHKRIYLCISLDEIREDCVRSATEQTEHSYKKHSWSGTIEAISRSVAAYQRAADATEHSACEDILKKLKNHVQALLQKCIPQAYLREYAMSIITDYIWNRTCNVALLMLLDNILEPSERRHGSFQEALTARGLSQRELNVSLDILKACIEHLRASSDQMLAHLCYYCRKEKADEDMRR